MRRIAAAAAGLVLFLAGCGEEHPAPDLLGERLDRAKDQLKQVGLDNKIEDDTLFGVLEESNFTVCEQRPEAGTMTGEVTVVVDRSCPKLERAAEEERIETGAPVEVTAKDLEFIADTIITEFRKEAALLEDYRSDYDAECKETGEGEATCTIQPFDNGDPLLPYDRKFKFDPSDPSRFEGAGIESPNGGL